MYKKAFLVFLGLFFFSNIALSENKKPKENTNNFFNSMQDRTPYRWYTDNSCKPTDRDKCLSLTEVKQICNLLTGHTEWFRKTLSIFSTNERERVLISAGIVHSERYFWVNNLNKCGFEFILSGMYQGTSTKVKMYGEVTTFVKVDSDLIAHEAGIFTSVEDF